jgi:chromosome segregation ATPase
MMRDNHRLIQVLKGSSVNHKLESQKNTLALIQAADILSLEGYSRASASEVAARAAREFNISVTPAAVGQSFSELSIRKVTIHGKSCFVLDHNQLKSIHEQIAGQCQEAIQKLQSIVTTYQELPSRIEALHEHWRNILQLQSRQRELEKLIIDNQDQVVKTANLQKKWEQLQSEAQKAVELGSQCQSLTQKIKELPEMTQRKTALQARIDKYYMEEKEIASREVQLANAIRQLQSRTAWVDLATLLQAVQNTKQELDQLARQLGEKRSLLDRLMHRKEGG